MNINIRKDDVIWGYLSQFFSVLSGIIILPIILRLLSPEEVGFNYVLLSVGQLVSLVDFGFSPQFGRNITYVFSGSNKLLKNGIETVNPSTAIIDYKLLANLIQTAKLIYTIMAIVVLLILATFGTFYIFRITNGFSTINQVKEIWTIYVTSVFFQIYFSYYNALLVGAGKIMEDRKALVYSGIFRILSTYLLLICGFGLLGVVTVNLLYPFLYRIISHRYFFTKEIKEELNKYKIILHEKIALFKILWHNTKKMGFSVISGYMTYGASTLFAGMFLSLSDVASFGLMTQLATLVVSIAGILFTVYQPRFAALAVSGDKTTLRKEAAFTMTVIYISYFILAFLIISLAPIGLKIIGSKTTLPIAGITALWLIFRFLDTNFWNLCQLMIANNEFPFFYSTVITAIAITVGSFLSLKYTNMGILGIVLTTGFAQCAYNNWYWPHKIMERLNTNACDFIKEGFREIKFLFVSKCMK